jgi:hypothetical protein
MKRHFVAAAVMIGSLGCGRGPFDAPPGALISEIDDIKVSWSGCDIDPQTGEQVNPNCETSPPVLIKLTLQVANETTRQPYNNVWISFMSTWHEIFTLPPEVIEAVELPAEGNWGDVEGTVAEIAGYQADEEYRPTYYETATDKWGRGEVWIWVETMPTDDAGEVKDGGIIVDIGSDWKLIKMTGGT